MSIEKLSENSRFKKAKVPFTQIANKVIEHIKDNDAFRIWCYLQSKTANWKVIKQEIKKKFGLGNGKIKDIFSYLNRSKLIEYVQITGSNGKFERMDIHVLNGLNFDINQPFAQVQPVGQKTARRLNRPPADRPLLNKDKYTKQIKREEIRISCSSDDELKSFEQFWLLYPRKQKKIDAFRIWKKNKLYEKLDDIQLHLMKRLELEWKSKEKKYIPLASTFLNGERWTDEIIENSPIEFNKPRNGRDVSRAYLQKAGIL